MFDIRDHGGMFGGNGGASGGGNLNVYVQNTEPTKKDGLWIKDTGRKGKIINDLDLWFANAWNDPNLHPLASPPINYNQSYGCSVGDFIYMPMGANQFPYLYRYDTINNIWEMMPDAPFSYSLGNAVAVGNVVYVFCQSSVSNYQTLIAFDTVSKTWSTKANIPFAFNEGSVASVGTDIYLFGGLSNTKTTYKYDTLTNTYTKLTDIPYSFSYGSASAVGSNIYLMGGNGSPSIDSCYMYDTLNNTWSAKATMPKNVKYHQSVTIGSKIYVIGGTGTTVTVKILIYDAINNTWSYGSDLPYEMFYSTVAYCNKAIYSIGGIGSSPITHYTDIRAYYFNSKVYEDGTVLLYRTSDSTGTYATELLTPRTTAYTGPFTKLLTRFNNVFYYKGGTLQENLPTYYGDGTKWIKFKGV